MFSASSLAALRTALIPAVSFDSYPDQELRQDGQFGHGTTGERYGRHRSQTHEQLDLTSQLRQCGERHECWETRG